MDASKSYEVDCIIDELDSVNRQLRQLAHDVETSHRGLGNDRCASALRNQAYRNEKLKPRLLEFKA